MTAHRVAAAEVPPGTVTGAGAYVVGHNVARHPGEGRSRIAGDEGEYFAVSRRCRHLRADLAEGSIDADGCLVCPWHQAKYDVTSGRMVRGPQGVFAKIPGLGPSFLALTRVWPLRRGKITRVGDDLLID